LEINIRKPHFPEDIAGLPESKRQIAIENLRTQCAELELMLSCYSPIFNYLASVTEMAMAMVTQKVWHPLEENGNPSHIGQNIRVRGTSHEDGRLLVLDADDDDDLYVLAMWQLSEPNRVEFKGFLTGKSAKIERYRTDFGLGRTYYAVPQSDLSPMSALVQASSDREEIKEG
jgi:hypothetical protein